MLVEKRSLIPTRIAVSVESLSAAVFVDENTTWCFVFQVIEGELESEFLSRGVECSLQSKDNKLIGENINTRLAKSLLAPGRNYLVISERSITNFNALITIKDAIEDK